MNVDVRPDGVALVTLDTGDAEHNVFDDAFASQLAEALGRIRDDARITAAVLRSRKRASFVVGRGVEAILGIRLARDGEQMARRFAAQLRGIRETRKPVVAAIHGAAHGAGFELALACSGIVATDDARTSVAFPEVALGLIPAGNGVLRAADRAGLQVAAGLGIHGTAVDAARARRLGLVDEVCPETLLIEVAAWRARTAAATSRTSRARRVLERNVLGRRAVLAQARATLGRVSHNPAPRRIVELVDRFARDGFDAAAAFESRAFGELVVSQSARTLMEVERAQTDVALDVPVAYADRLLAVRVNEARSLVDDGVSRAALRDALLDWGWQDSQLPIEPSSGLSSRAPSISREEIQIRYALRFLNEALACLDEGTIGEPRAGDAHAIMAHGFPAFRGGPFRYVDAVGPAEILRRMRACETRVGPRFHPAPALITRASTGERFYPD